MKGAKSTNQFFSCLFLPLVCLCLPLLSSLSQSLSASERLCLFLLFFSASLSLCLYFSLCPLLIVRTYYCLSVSVSLCLLLLFFVRLCQSLSAPLVFVRLCQSSSASVSLCPPLKDFVCFYYSMSSSVCCCLYLLVFVIIYLAGFSFLPIKCHCFSRQDLVSH